MQIDGVGLASCGQVKCFTFDCNVSGAEYLKRRNELRIFVDSTRQIGQKARYESVRGGSPPLCGREKAAPKDGHPHI